MSRGLIPRLNHIFKLKPDCGIPYAFRSLNVQRRWKSSAASVPSGNRPKVKGKWVSKRDKRREIVVSFVDRYREMNAGKFPTASITNKEVGGSYYVVKRILQELEFDYRSSPLNKQNTSISPKEIVVDNEAVGEVHVLESVDEIKESEADLGCEKSEMHPDVESISGTKDSSGNDDLKQIDTEYREPPEEKKPLRDIKENQWGNVESPKSRVWEGLKSLADGIIKFWKGM